jgi:uncharacterized protein (DUF1499 family)
MSILWWLPTVLILGMMAIGAGGAYLRVLEPGPGFYLFGISFPLAGVAALGLSAAAALGSARAASWRGAAVRAAAVPVLVSLLLLVLMPMAQSNPIHDVMTERSVGFLPQIAKLREGEDLETVFAQGQELYPDIASLELPEQPRDDAMLLALRVANGIPGWTVTSTDAKWGRIFATAESRVFHFVDDVAILVETRPLGGSLVHMRSRSRIGQSDLGANAARIRAYMAAVKQAAG